MEEQKMAAASEAAPDKEIKLGEVGVLVLDFSAGVATIKLSAAVPGSVGLEGGAFVKCDSEMLIKALFAALKSKFPPGVAPMVAAVEAVLVQAVKAIP